MTVGGVILSIEDFENEKSKQFLKGFRSGVQLTITTTAAVVARSFAAIKLDKESSLQRIGAFAKKNPTRFTVAATVLVGSIAYRLALVAGGKGDGVHT